MEDKKESKCGGNYTDNKISYIQNMKNYYAQKTEYNNITIIIFIIYIIIS